MSIYEGQFVVLFGIPEGADLQHSFTDVSQSASDGIHVDSGPPPNATSAFHATTGSTSADREDDCVKKVLWFCKDHRKI
ncbi:hypothetical protein DPMN_136582 [Dreissena polymorpha]|uniref:Uncharacterized protein n=1 Tax=Dreissena polymorpha TaxID=45954 RepID=A0A9D4G332_DREPO|nr:hypothetical protein DPMN_136582 [Dreissena polymorpha]